MFFFLNCFLLKKPTRFFCFASLAVTVSSLSCRVSRCCNDRQFTLLPCVTVLQWPSVHCPAVCHGAAVTVSSLSCRVSRCCSDRQFTLLPCVTVMQWPSVHSPAVCHGAPVTVSSLYRERGVWNSNERRVITREDIIIGRAGRLDKWITHSHLVTLCKELRPHSVEGRGSVRRVSCRPFVLGGFWCGGGRMWGVFCRLGPIQHWNNTVEVRPNCRQMFSKEKIDARVEKDAILMFQAEHCKPNVIRLAQHRYQSLLRTPISLTVHPKHTLSYSQPYTNLPGVSTW